MDIEKYIVSQLEAIDIREIVVGEVHQAVSEDIRQKISEVIRTKINSIVDEEIELALSKGITTDDGWGKRVQYKSFEELFKQEFRAKFDNTWEVKNTIEKVVKEKVNTLFTASFKEVTDKIVAELVRASK
jgi:hypothetical protein